MSDELPLVVIPADEPVQIGNSPQLERLRGHARVKLYSDRPTLEEQVERVRDADILLNSRGHIEWRSESLRELSKLKMITTCSIGTDAIDLVAARSQGIVVSNIPGRTARLVAEHTLSLMLAAAKRLSFQTAEMKAGRWTQRMNLTLHGGTLGVVGMGSIGQQVALLGKAIGMDVIAWSFHPSPERGEQLGVKFVELPELLSRSDVVSVHVRLSDDSRGLIGRDELALMKSDALLINTARGPVVDTEALIEHLNAGRLAGAAIDVYDEEPPPADHPLLACEQVVLTPHSADQTPEGVEILNKGAVDNVLAFLSGTPQNVVN